MTRSYVVTGAGRGVGRAIAEHVAAEGPVVAVDRDPGALAWTEHHPDVEGLAGDATDDTTLAAAVRLARRAGTLTGWVNNAAVFTDAAVHDTPAADVLALVTANLGLALAGSAAAIRQFLDDDTAGAVVNVSSHQAQRAVPGALPYATAKAAVEGLTRALAVDYAPRPAPPGPRGTRRGRRVRGRVPPVARRGVRHRRGRPGRRWSRRSRTGPGGARRHRRLTRRGGAGTGPRLR